MSIVEDGLESDWLDASGQVVNVVKGRSMGNDARG